MASQQYHLRHWHLVIACWNMASTVSASLNMGKLAGLNGPMMVGIKEDRAMQMMSQCHQRRKTNVAANKLSDLPAISSPCQPSLCCLLWLGFLTSLYHAVSIQPSMLVSGCLQSILLHWKPLRSLSLDVFCFFTYSAYSKAYTLSSIKLLFSASFGIHNFYVIASSVWEVFISNMCITIIWCPCCLSVSIFLVLCFPQQVISVQLLILSWPKLWEYSGPEYSKPKLNETYNLDQQFACSIRIFKGCCRIPFLVLMKLVLFVTLFIRLPLWKKPHYWSSWMNSTFFIQADH